jgi:hypothetical protein
MSLFNGRPGGGGKFFSAIVGWQLIYFFARPDTRLATDALRQVCQDSDTHSNTPFV